MTLFGRYPPAAMHLRSNVTVIGDHVVLALDGVADLSAVPVLHDVLRKFVTDHPARSLAIDLDGVTVLDDAALGLLLGAAADARRLGGELRVVSSDARVRRRLSETRFDRAVEIGHSLSDQPTPVDDRPDRGFGPS